MSPLEIIAYSLCFILVTFLFAKLIGNFEQKIDNLADAQRELHRFVAEAFSAVIKDRTELAHLVREATESVIKKNEQADAPDETKDEEK